MPTVSALLALAGRTLAPVAARPKTNRYMSLQTAVVFLSVTSLVPAWARADIHRSVDENGVISFSNTPSRRSSHTASKADASYGVHMPSDRSLDRLSRYDDHIRQASALYHIPAPLIRAVIQAESNFDPRALSPAGAHGLMQLMPFTAERMMVSDIFDPRQNIMGGTRYLRVLANMFNGDIHLTLAAYNAGEGAVVRYGGIPPYEETQGYVVRVLSNYERYRANETDSGTLAAAVR